MQESHFAQKRIREKAGPNHFSLESKIKNTGYKSKSVIKKLSTSHSFHSTLGIISRYFILKKEV